MHVLLKTDPFIFDFLYCSSASTNFKIPKLIDSSLTQVLTDAFYPANPDFFGRVSENAYRSVILQKEKKVALVHFQSRQTQTQISINI